MTKSEATSAAKRLLAQMSGRGWKIRVWENMGWHYSVETRGLSVTEHLGLPIIYRFHCMLRPHYTFFGSVQHAAYPNKAVIKCLCAVRQSLREYNNILDEAQRVYEK